MWNDLSMAERAKYIKLGVQSGITNLNTIRRSYNSFARGGYTKLEEDTKEHKGIGVNNDLPLYIKDSTAHYEPTEDTIYAPEDSGEFYDHEMFHARPNRTMLDELFPYYDKLNDNRLLELGADMDFIMRSGDPGQYYSPEEVGARVAASIQALNRAGIEDITDEWINLVRKNETKYGDNFRDLLRMYNNANLINILNIGRRYYPRRNNK